ncbi:MAG TPA: GDSL-type esterase/lipase family protein [Pyrinomonadaceae bacterium]|nr:GDSL-type esterase/lipase family protein [Pyrinomonadaceae bacterium]
MLRLFWPQPSGPVQFAFDRQRGAIPKPNQTGRRVVPGVFDYTYSNNSLGLRGREIGPKQRFRILLLGDSFTYGLGVNDTQTFASRLESLTGSETINAGDPGTGTDYALRFYETLGRQLAPDVVILCFFSNDFQDNQRHTYYDDDLRPRDLSNNIVARKMFLDSRAYNWLITHSHLANLIKASIIRIQLFEKPIDEPQVDVNLTRRYIEMLKQKVREDNKQFLVIYLPSSVDVQNFRQQRDVPTDMALRSIQEDLSLTPPIANSNLPLDDLYFVSDQHWTATTHEIAARSIAEFLRDRPGYHQQ